MDNKTYIENKKKELSILEDDLWLYKFSFYGLDSQKKEIRNLELKIKEIEKELEDNELQDV